MKQVKKTDHDTILIINVEMKDKNNITITADEIAPLLYSEAIERNREYLEDGELWKQAVEGGHTTLGLDEWVEMVIDTEGEINMIDCSLYDQNVIIDGNDYVFESLGCGCMHDEIMKVYPKYKPFIDAHLIGMHAEANYIYNYEQKHKKKPTSSQVKKYLADAKNKQVKSYSLYVDEINQGEQDIDGAILKIARDIVKK